MKNATRPPTVEIVTPSSCNVCKGALLSRKPIGEEDICTCPPPQYWSGSECVSKAECPCYEGHISYEVGEFYQTENCSECVCKIGGSPDCKPKSCPACPKGQKRVSPGSCSCKCEKCPPETILCQTSGECIEESSWCDGIQDCPDDEMNCTQSGKPVIIVSETVSKNITKKCPVPTCPEGFLVKERKAPRKSKMLSSRFANDDDDPPQQQYYYIKAKYTATYEAMLPISTSKQDDINSEQCIEFICVPIVHDPTDVDYGDETFNKTTRCSEPKCPPGYIIRLQILTKPQQCAK